MTKVMMGDQKIQITPQSTGTPFILDWDKWTLTKSVDNLHKFSCTPILDETWVDFESETGFKVNIGDELEFWATFGNERGADTKRFGGYVQSMNPHYDGSVTLDINANDYRYLLQRMEVFKDYYKLMTVSISNYAEYVQRLYNANTLSEAIYYICTAAGFTDFSLLEHPYAFLALDSVVYTRSVGSTSIDVLFDGFPQEPGYPYRGDKTHWLSFRGEAEFAFTVYSDTQGYDANAYPYLTLNLLTNEGAEFGLRVTVNGSYVYIPWYSDLSGYTGTKTNSLVPNVYNTKTNIVIPLKDLLDQTSPATTYKITKVEIVNKKTGGTPTGSIFISKFGACDPYQANEMRHEYIHKNGYEICNMLAKDCNHYFNITPHKQPVIYNNAKRITAHSIIEGENLIESNANYDDEDLVNNYMCLSNLEGNNVLFAQEIDLESMTRHGRYDRIDEESDIDNVYSMKTYSQDQVAKLGKLLPNLECTIIPDFSINEGELVYVYNPSMGVEKSLMVNEITFDSDGGCRVTLGQPTNDLITYIKKMSRKTNSLSNRSTKIQDNMTKSKVDMMNQPFDQIVGYTNITGMDIVAPGIDLISDMNEYGAPKWRDSSDVISINNSGVDLYRPASLSEFIHIISAVPLNNPKFKYIKKVTVDYEYTGFYNSIIMAWAFYSNYDITDNTKNQMYSTYSTVLSGKSNASGTGSVVIYEKGVSPKDLPPVPYYHLDLSFFSSSTPEWYGHFKVTGIRTEYVAER
jgi:hypothetical protein